MFCFGAEIIRDKPGLVCSLTIVGSGPGPIHTPVFFRGQHFFTARSWVREHFITLDHL